MAPAAVGAQGACGKWREAAGAGAAGAGQSAGCAHVPAGLAELSHPRDEQALRSGHAQQSWLPAALPRGHRQAVRTVAHRHQGDGGQPAFRFGLGRRTSSCAGLRGSRGRQARLASCTPRPAQTRECEFAAVEAYPRARCRSGLGGGASGRAEAVGYPRGRHEGSDLGFYGRPTTGPGRAAATAVVCCGSGAQGRARSGGSSSSGDGGGTTRNSTRGTSGLSPQGGFPRACVPRYAVVRGRTRRAQCRSARGQLERTDGIAGR